MKLLYAIFGTVIFFTGIICGIVIKNNTQSAALPQQQQNPPDNNKTKAQKISTTVDVTKYVKITPRFSDDDRIICIGFKIEFIDRIFRDTIADKYISVSLEIPQLYYAGTLPLDKAMNTATVTFPEPRPIQGVQWHLIGMLPGNEREVILEGEFE